MKKDLSKIVIPTKDSNYADNRPFINAPIYKEKLEGIIKPVAPNCFMGAYYHKVFTAKDIWYGIEGTITLGEFIPDPKRFGSDNRVDFDRVLDSPSIYMGGFALAESDAGLGWNIGYEYKGQEAEMNYGAKKVAYRPFWRYIYSSVKDIETNVERNNVNSWNVSNVEDFDFYYFPGDKVKIAVYSPTPNYLQLRIELLEPTKIEKYAKVRESFKLERSPRVFYSPLFISEGHGDGKTKSEYKRVNSIDQYGNEGFIVKKTDSVVTKAVWENTFLFKKINNVVMRVPMDNYLVATMTCPNLESFETKQQDMGGEEILIKPYFEL